MVAGLVAVAIAAIVSTVVAIGAAGNRSDRADRLADDVDTLQGERDELAAELERRDEESAIFQSRWLAAIAAGGTLSPSDSRLVAVEAATVSPTPEAIAALGHVVFVDPRSDSPVVELDHGGPVWTTATAGGADAVVTGSDDTTAKVWSTSGELLATLDHSSRVRAVDVSGDDRFIATGSADGAVTTWTIAGEEVASLAHDDQVNDVAIDETLGLVMSGGHDGAAIVAEVGTGDVRHVLDHPGIVLAVALPDRSDRPAATGGEDGQFRLWDLDAGTEVDVHDLDEAVTTLAFSPDGRWLLAGGQQGTAILIDIDAGTAGSPLEGTFRGGVVDVDWRADGDEVAVVSLGGVNRYELPDGQLVAEHRLTGGTRGAAYAPDGTWIVTASGDFQFNFGQITFWDTVTGAQLVALNLGGPVETITVHPSGTVLAGYRSTEDLVEIGGAWLVPGPAAWISLACAGTDGVIGEQTWAQLTGEASSHRPACPDQP